MRLAAPVRGEQRVGLHLVLLPPRFSPLLVILAVKGTNEIFFVGDKFYLIVQFLCVIWLFESTTDLKIDPSISKDNLFILYFNYSLIDNIHI